MLKQLTKAYQHLIYYSAFLKSPLLLLCRLYWGWAFVNSGMDKLNGIDKFTEFLANHHFILPHFDAYLVGTVEFVGGFCLILGVASRLAALILAFQMLVAYATVHWEGLKALFYQPSIFVSEAPFNFLLISLFVLAFGPGRFSFDYFFERWTFHRAQSIPTHQHLPEDDSH